MQQFNVNDIDLKKLKGEILKLELVRKYLNVKYINDIDTIMAINEVAGHSVVIYNMFLNGRADYYNGDKAELLKNADYERFLILSKNIKNIRLHHDLHFSNNKNGETKLK